MAIATALRKHSGGSILDFSSEDPLVRPVMELAQDYYPALLLPRSERSPFDISPFPLPLGLVTLSHPANSAVATALTKEEPLRKLFPEGDIELDSYTRQFVARSGRGSAATVSFLASTFLINAEPNAWQSGQLSLESYLDAVRREIEAARTLAGGKETTVRASVGLAPAELPDDWRLSTPWGILRAPNHWERRWAPAETGAVLDIEFPMAIHVGDLATAKERKQLARFMDPIQEMEAEVDRLRLALILATASERPFAVSPVWQLIPDPLQLPGFRTGFARPLPGAGNFDEVREDEIQRWCGLVRDKHSPNLDLPARRLLSSLTTRTQPEDGLVDAMVALESLFGTGQGEIRFRLSVALAWLLEADAKGRSVRQKQVFDLYGKRSKVVHGEHLSPQVAQKSHAEATQLVVAALRSLFAERPDLIDDKHRGKILTLQGLPAAD